MEYDQIAKCLTVDTDNDGDNRLIRNGHLWWGCQTIRMVCGTFFIDGWIHTLMNNMNPIDPRNGLGVKALQDLVQSE